MDDPNPYRAPNAARAGSDVARRWAARPGRMLIGWTAVVLSNLPVALLFGVGFTDGEGRVGMGAGVGLLWLAGCGVVVRPGRAGMALIVGGAAVALTQVFAIPQVVAGSLGVRAAMAVGLAGPSEDLAAVRMTGWGGGLVAAVVTGGLLMGLALGLGLVVPRLAPSAWARRAGTGVARGDRGS